MPWGTPSCYKWFYNFSCSFRRPSVRAEQTRHPDIEVLMPWRLQSHLVTVRPLYFDGDFRSFGIQAKDIMNLFANFADIWHYYFSVFSLKDEPWGKQYLYISKGNGKVIFLMFPCFLEMKKDLKIFRFKDQLTGAGTTITSMVKERSILPFSSSRIQITLQNRRVHALETVLQQSICLQLSFIPNSLCQAFLWQTEKRLAAALKKKWNFPQNGISTTNFHIRMKMIDSC